MSVVGPRPALWNQDVLISERDKYHESKVIRNIEALNLSKKSEILAQKLIEKIDMPVVFEINSQKDKNYGARHNCPWQAFFTKLSCFVKVILTVDYIQ